MTGTAAVLQVDATVDPWLPTLHSLRAAHPDLPIVVGMPVVAPAPVLDRYGVEMVTSASLGALVDTVWRRHRGHVLVVAAPAAFARGALDTAAQIVDDDLRVATVSWWSNAAGFLSFPHRDHPIVHHLEGLDVDAATTRLRTIEPVLVPAPIPYATGPAVLLSSAGLSVTGPLDENTDDPQVLLADHSLRARKRGMVDVVDPSTVCIRLFDGDTALVDTWLSDEDERTLAQRHRFSPADLRADSADAGSPLSIAHQAARSKVIGLRILIDGTCLGPHEMGTQVALLALIDSLCQRGDVSQVGVVLGGPRPGYAEGVLAHSKIDARVATGNDLGGFGGFDIVHRPYQPDRPIDFDLWHAAGARAVVSLQDLIAYHVATYHATPASWHEYRRTVRSVASRADAIVTISHDARRQVEVERLPVEPSRLFAVQDGTDHITGSERDQIPTELLARGYVAGTFLVVLGANYSHKNRDLAVAAHQVLADRGHVLGLVLAGPSVPFGSSRSLEARAWGPRSDEQVFVLPDVTSAERNWLLRHAAVLVYPTSAEGFGLVPYEAACFGTPTVMVPFGPLAEIAGALPVEAADWDPTSIADAVQALLEDPALARAQVEALAARVADHRWERTGSELVDVYRTVLAAPARGRSTEPPA